MVTATELYFRLKKILGNNGIQSSQFEAMCIVEHIFGEKLEKILINKIDASEQQVALTDNIVFRRTQGEPLQYILGKWEFYGLEFFVGEGVLIPRQDTETMIDETLKLKLPQCPKIIDLCSGSGCIGITINKKIPDAQVTAVENSEKALSYLNKNIALNNAKIKIVMGDVLNEKTAEQFSDIDLILCNPPYLTSEDMKNLQKEVTFEPKEALFGGNDGMRFYKNITAIWKNILKSGGYIYYEIGIGQEDRVTEILMENNFVNIRSANDLCGITRVVSGQKR